MKPFLLLGLALTTDLDGGCDDMTTIRSLWHSLAN